MCVGPTLADAWRSFTSDDDSEIVTAKVMFPSGGTTLRAYRARLSRHRGDSEIQ